MSDSGNRFVNMGNELSRMMGGGSQQNQQNYINQQMGMYNNVSMYNNACMDRSVLLPHNPTPAPAKKKLSIREELQQEINVWLKDVI